MPWAGMLFGGPVDRVKHASIERRLAKGPKRSRTKAKLAKRSRRKNRR